MGFESKQDFLNYKYKILPKLKGKKLKKKYNAESNSIFVGEYGYPNVNLGVLSTEDYSHNDNSQYWVQNNWKISEIANSRLDLLNSKKVNPVKQSSDYLTEAQEIALAKKTTEVEIELKRNPVNKFSISQYFKPQGPSAELQKLKLSENAKVPTYVNKVVSDDLKATEGLGKLYGKDFEKDYLVQAFTSGSLGIDKKLVPTKWGITAVDDILGKQLIEKIKMYDSTGNLAFMGDYLGNYFLVLMFEGEFSYELFEFFRDVEEYTTDYENSSGRKKYAIETAGGYYAARISLLEKLKEMKRKSKCLVLRFITDDYYMPLGVWVVREAVKNTMESKPIEFGSKELMLDFAKKFSTKKFNRDLSFLDVKSKVLTERTIFDFENDR